jgi:hypothetical protein
MDEITTTTNQSTTNPIPATPPPVKPSVHKKTYIIIAVFVIFVLIGAIPFFLNRIQTKPQAIAPTPTTAAIVLTPSPVPGELLTEQEKTAIVEQIKPDLKKQVAVDYTVPKAKGYGDNWAILQIVNPSTDPALVVVEKVNGVWTIKLGPGTYFDDESLQASGAPQNLINEINNPL